MAKYTQGEGCAAERLIRGYPKPKRISCDKEPHRDHGERETERGGVFFLAKREHNQEVSVPLEMMQGGDVEEREVTHTGNLLAKRASVRDEETDEEYVEESTDDKDWDDEDKLEEWDDESGYTRYNQKSKRPRGKSSTGPKERPMTWTKPTWVHIQERTRMRRPGTRAKKKDRERMETGKNRG